MAEHRPFPPSPRRRALAVRAGIHAASPLLVGALAAVAALLVTTALGASAIARLRIWIGDAASGSARALAPRDVLPALLELVTPLLAAAALAALVTHLAQTRSLWLPRRSIDGAPALDRGPAARVRRVAFELAAAAILGGLITAWLWLVAPRLAALTTLPFAGTSLLASALASIAIAWVAIGVLDALLRHIEVAHALQMSTQERRDDLRLAGADPRWRAHRDRLHRSSDLSTAIAGSSLLLLGDDLAVAIAWDPIRRPVPVRTATGHAARATQLLGLARRHRIPVHRDPDLARRLDGDGPVPEAHWPRLAELVAALRRP